MTQASILREVEEKLYRGAASSFLGQAAIVNKTFVGEIANDKLLRLTVKLFEAVSESLHMLASEIDELRDQLTRLETGAS